MGSCKQGIVLIGVRRSGKSTVGRRLAAEIGLPFVDLDHLIGAREGMPVRDILLQHGEEEFRTRESRAVVAAVAGAPCVIATGGGTPLRADNRRRLGAFGRVILLRVGAHELVRRLASDPDPHQRPLLAGGDPEEEVRILLERREALYLEWADAVVDAEGAVAEVCARCRHALEGV